MDEDRELVTPLSGLKRRAEHGGAQVAPGSVPTRALFTWGEPLFEVARQFAHAKPTDLKAGVAKLYRGTWAGEPFILVNPGIGAPATALVADKLHACGVDTFVGIGFAGIVHPLLQSGDIVVVERAIGEDGTSRAYLEGTDEVLAAPIVKSALEGSLGEDPDATYQCGTVWTTDTPYRETVRKAKGYRARGVHAVEMETAALLAVAKRRGFRAGAMVVLSDSLCRVAPLDQAGDQGIDWTWTPAPAGSLDGKIMALVRGALPVVVGPLADVAAAHAH
jgi:uridine phosphorylase